MQLIVQSGHDSVLGQSKSCVNVGVIPSQPEDSEPGRRPGEDGGEHKHCNAGKKLQLQCWQKAPEGPFVLAAFVWATSTGMGDNGRNLLISAAVTSTCEQLAEAAKLKVHPARITAGNRRLFRQSLIAAAARDLSLKCTVLGGLQL